MPRRTAAPCGPPSTHPVSSSTARMCLRSAAARVSCGVGRAGVARAVQVSEGYLQDRPRREDHRPLDDILQFANVARPGVLD